MPGTERRCPESSSGYWSALFKKTLSHLLNSEEKSAKMDEENCLVHGRWRAMGREILGLDNSGNLFQLSGPFNLWIQRTVYQLTPSFYKLLSPSLSSPCSSLVPAYSSRFFHCYPICTTNYSQSDSLSSSKHPSSFPALATWVGVSLLEMLAPRFHTQKF